MIRDEEKEAYDHLNFNKNDIVDFSNSESLPTEYDSNKMG